MGNLIYRAIKAIIFLVILNLIIDNATSAAIKEAFPYPETLKQCLWIVGTLLTFIWLDVSDLLSNSDKAKERQDREDADKGYKG